MMKRRMTWHGIINITDSNMAFIFFIIVSNKENIFVGSSLVITIIKYRIIMEKLIIPVVENNNNNNDRINNRWL